MRRRLVTPPDLQRPPRSSEPPRRCLGPRAASPAARLRGAWLGLLLAACAPRPGLEPASDAEGSAPPAGAAAPPPAETGSAVATVSARTGVVADGSGAPEAEAPWTTSEQQLLLAGRLRAARAADTPRAQRYGTELALRDLAQSLAAFRGAAYEAPLVDALQTLSLTPDLVAAVDARMLIPAVEVLLDIADGAAIERLLAPHRGGPAEPALAGPAGLVEQWRGRAALTLAPAPCDVVLDGSAIAAGTHPLVAGSHAVGCAGAAPRRFVVVAGDLGLHFEGDPPSPVLDDTPAPPP